MAIDGRQSPTYRIVNNRRMAVANNYLEFSEVIPNLSAAEEAWLKEQLQPICVFGDKEYPEDAVPAELAGTAPDWYGSRFLRGKDDYDPECDGRDFECSLHDDHDTGGCPRRVGLCSADATNGRRERGT